MRLAIEGVKPESYGYKSDRFIISVWLLGLPLLEGELRPPLPLEMHDILFRQAAPNGGKLYSPVRYPLRRILNFRTDYRCKDRIWEGYMHGTQVA